MLSKKRNQVILLIILTALVAVYIITRFTGNRERTFESKLVTADSAAVTKIEIIPRRGKPTIILTRTGDAWSVESAGKTYSSDPDVTAGVLTELLKMTPERVAATDKSKWAEMEVADTNAIRVKVYEGRKVTTDLFVGKFSYSKNEDDPNPMSRNKGKMATYIRVKGDETVYAVPGFIKMTIQSDVAAYRNKTVCTIAKDNITKVAFNYPDGNFLLSRETGRWTVDGQPADSLKVENYFKKITKVVSSNYMDDFVLGNVPAYQVKIEGNNMIPIEIKAFPADTVNKFVIVSSLNPEGKFSAEKSKIFDRLFTKKTDLLPASEEKN